MNDKKYLYCYKMTDDTGFAPNPYHDVLTLATCKPTIRRCAKEDYWISGWTSVSVEGKNGKRMEFRDKQKLIYLAKVSEVLPIENYWKRYKEKRPNKMCNGMLIKRKQCGKNGKVESGTVYYDCGDNIYEPSCKAPLGFKLHPNSGHKEEEKAHDLSGKNVLVCEEFYYFGVENAFEIEVNDGFYVHRCKKLELESNEAKIIIKKVKEIFDNQPGKYEDYIKQKRI